MAQQKMVLNLSGTATELIGAVRSAVNSLNGLGGVTKKLNVNLRVTEDQIKRVMNQFPHFSRGQAAMAAAAGDAAFLRGELSRLNVGQKVLNVSINAAEKEIEQQRSAIQRLIPVLQRYGDALMKSRLMSPDTQAIGKAWRNVLSNLRWQFTNFVNGIRLISQGMMSVFRSLAIGVALPAMFAMRGLFNTMVDFEDALVRVRKTTGLEEAQIKTLAGAIREFSQVTVSSQVELAKMAEQIGQLGVRDLGSIEVLIKLFERLVVATDIGADTIAASMGRIANAFSIDLNTEEGVSEIIRLSNVINKLENETASTASQIVSALETFAPTAGLLRISAFEAAGLTAALVEMGVSADAAGTRLGAMFQMLILHKDEVGEIMQETGKYADEVDFLNQVNEDAVQVLADVLDEMNKTGNRADALSKIFGTLGRVGGKAAGSLSANWERVNEILGITQKEYLEAISLEEEYQIALNSTASQLKMAQNVWNELGLTLSQVLLPLVNEVLPVLVEGVKFLTEQFAALPKETQQAVIIFTVLAAVLAPVLFFVSQIGFGLAMMLLGIIRVVGTALSLVKVLGALVGFFMTLAKAGPLVFVGVIAGMGLLLKAFQDAGVDIASFFEWLADEAFPWGAKLIEEYVGGIVSTAATLISQALTAIANMIARFLRGSSPPPEGPLSSINKWGVKVMEAYLQGFLNADFSILSKVGGILRRIFDNFVQSGVMGKAESLGFFGAARTAVAELIKIFNETGNIAENVMDKITKNLGFMGEHVEKLIRLWLEYNKIQKELAEIEKAKQLVFKKFDADVTAIMGSGMSPEEQAEAIRQAMLSRNEELGVLTEQEEALKEQSEEMKEKLEWQQSFIDALLETEDIELAILDALKDIKDAVGSLAGVVGTDLEDAFEKIESKILGILELQETMNEAALKFQAFWAGIQGISLGDSGLGIPESPLAQQHFKESLEAAGLPVPDIDGIVQWHDWGMKINDVWQDWSEKIDTVAEHLGTVAGILEDVFGEGGTLEGQDTGNLLGLAGLILFGPRIMKIVMWLLRNVPKLGGIWVGLRKALPIVAARVGSLAGRFGFLKEGLIAFGAILAGLSFPLWVTVGILLAIAVGIGIIIWKWENLVQLWEDAKVSLPIIWEHIKQKVHEKLFQMIDDLDAWVAEGIEKATEWGKGIIDGIRAGIDEKYQEAVEKITELGEGIKQAWNTLWGIENEEQAAEAGFWYNFGVTVIDAFVAGIRSVLDILYALWNEIFTHIWETYLAPLIDALNNLGMDGPGFQGGGAGGGGDASKPGRGQDPKGDGSGFGSVGGSQKVAATGGVVWEPTALIAGEREAEAIIPISRFPAVMDQFLSKVNVAPVSDAGGMGVININIGEVRDQRDIDKIAREVEKIMNRNLIRQARYR